ncbi:MAG: Abi family protein [Tissierellia bacterium]|nr:Abi family protein [Tissierellia bacterium]
MKKTHQEPMNLNDQIKNLISLNLEIGDKVYAKKILDNVSYYRLVKAYSITLKKDGKYIDGTSFENIVELYQFDVEFRHILFSLIENIEVRLRAVITNYFSLKYGNFGYENINNYDNKYGQQKVLNELHREIDRNKRSPFIKNFKENYEGGKIPLYAAMEVTSFGTLSKMYRNMKAEDKREIARKFDVDYTYLQSWIENLAYVRNICAHYGRLYGAKLTKSPALYKEYKAQNISNNMIFATILNLKILADEAYYEEFYNRLLEIIKKYKSVDLKNLGFVAGWDDLLNKSL